MILRGRAALPFSNLSEANSSLEVAGGEGSVQSLDVRPSYLDAKESFHSPSHPRRGAAPGPPQWLVGPLVPG